MINLAKNERVLLVIRKHWFILFSETLFLLFLFMLPFLVGFVAAYLETIGLIHITSNEIPLFMFFLFAWIIILWLTFFVIWTDYYLDVLIVTDKHIIDIQQRGLFSRDVSTLRFDRMQDITIEVHGLIATLLKFGTIQIQTAGESREFIVKGIPNPAKVKNEILRIYNQNYEK